MRAFFRCLLAVLICAFIFIPAAFAAESPQKPEKYRRDFAFRDFRMNQDGLKFEVPENGAYKILPRLKNTTIWTHFQMPSEVQSKNEWIVRAVVRSSEGSAAGVGFWMGYSGYSFYMYPDGKGSLQYYDGKKSTWRTNVEVKNFSYPANLALRRDANGSIVAEVNDIVAAVRLFPIDMSEPKLSDVTSVSFSTHSPASMPSRGGVAVFYEKLEVEAWGEKVSQATVDRFEELFPTKAADK